MLRKYLRQFILPWDDLLAVFSGRKFARALDVGAGTGLVLETLYAHNIIAQGIGVEVNGKYFRKINDDVVIIDAKELDGDSFDLIIFFDVLHHVHNKDAFISYYLKMLRKGGTVLVKEMDNRNLIYTYYNKLHDLIMARELIEEISPEALERLLPDFQVAARGRKRIFLYDHYWRIFQAK